MRQTIFRVWQCHVTLNTPGLPLYWPASCSSSKCISAARCAAASSCTRTLFTRRLRLPLARLQVPASTCTQSHTTASSTQPATASLHHLHLSPRYAPARSYSQVSQLRGTWLPRRSS